MDETGVLPLWVFAYGSLLWNPGFVPAEAVTARLHGWRRSFCMTSIHYRGTVEAPGLVLALDAAEGAVCAGMALRVPDAVRDDVLGALRARELISSAYVEREVEVVLADGRRVTAVTYVIARDHPQYCILSPEAQARTIAVAVGDRGTNCAYLYNTVDHLHAAGIGDAELDELAAAVRGLQIESGK